MMNVPMPGEDMLKVLRAKPVELTEESSKRMLHVARDYGLVNFPVTPRGQVGQRGTVELYGLTYADGMYTLGDADFSNAKK